MTHVLSFDCQTAENFPLITPVVDGKSLVELVTEFERHMGYDDPAGGYGALIPETYFGPIDSYLFGKAGPIEGDEAGEIYLLGCECGVMGCWPLIGHVVIVDAEVRWERFRQPFRPVRDYKDFGPFTFDLTQYEIEVAKVRAFCA